MLTDANDLTGPLATPNGHYPELAVPAEARGLRLVVRDCAGAPVREARVTLIDDAGWQIARGVSDASGRCELPTMVRADFLLVVRHPAHLPLAMTLPSAAGLATAELEVRLSGAGRLIGVVTSAGSPASGAVITLADPAGTVVATGRTDSAGRYEFCDLTVGSATLTVHWGSAGRPVTIAVQIPLGGHARQDVALPGTASVSGIAQTPQGWVIGDARVSLIAADGSEVAVTRTDADGGYSFTALELGQYTVVAVGYPPASAEVVAGTGETHAPSITLAHADEHSPRPSNAPASPRTGSG